MMRSLFSGVSGLRNHQISMDAIGNNISNVNTPGYKSSTVKFSDMLSQTLQGASSPQGNRGGTNPMQIGLGMSVASVDTNFTDGSYQSTGKATDLSITGQGFFILADGDNRYYTRAGNFDFDTQGNYIVPGTGIKVMGWQADSSGNINTTQPVTTIRIPVGSSMAAKQSTKITFSKNLSGDSPLGDTSQVSTEVYDSLGVKHTVENQYYKIANNTWLVKTSVSDPTTAALTTSWRQLDFTNSGILNQTEAATVSQTTGYTLNNFQMDLTANAVHKQSYLYVDSSGNAHTYDVTYTTDSTTTPANGKFNWEMKESGVAGAPVTTGQITWNGAAYSAAATFPQIGGVAPVTATPVAPAAGLFTASATLTPAVTTTADVPSTVTFANGSAPMTLAMDYSQINQFAGANTVFADKDGYAAGTLNKQSFDANGIITGSFSNGQSLVLGQVALATFNNPGGLDHMGSSMYMQSNNSGDPQVGTAGNGGRGTFNPGALEMSNVDLSQQFTDMIVTERGFQANSKIITTSDEMLQDLVNLKR